MQSIAGHCVRGRGEGASKCARGEDLDKQCDKPVTMTCAEEELADIIIRALDTAYALKVDIDWAVGQKHFYNTSRPFRHGGKLA